MTVSGKYAVAGFVSFCMAAMSVQASVVTNVMVRSKAMDRDIPVFIVLPNAYERECSNRMDVVYVLHGAYGSAEKKAGDLALGRLVDLYGVIAVCPDGDKTSWWLDSPIDPKSQYETFVVREVVPYVDARWRTNADRKHRAIMGGSMGGHGACYLGMRHKDLFGAIGNVYGGVDLVPCAGHWEVARRLGPLEKFPERWEEHSVVNVAKTLKNGEVELICVLGTEDFLLGCNRQLHDLLSTHGVAHTYVEIRSDSALHSSHGHFSAQGASLCMRFIHNFFKDGYGHLGDLDVR